MATISVTLPADGSTADVADVNTPITTIVNAINGNLDNTNIAASAGIDGSKIADGGITNAKLSTATGEIGAAWQSFTPTLNNFTLGSGTKTGKYTKVGKRVRGEVYIAFGATMTFGTGFSITLPVTAATSYATQNHVPIGEVVFYDSSAAVFPGKVLLHNSATIALIYYMDATGAGTKHGYFQTTAANPMTLAASDSISIVFEYEAA